MTDNNNSRNSNNNHPPEDRQSMYRTTFDLSQEAKKALEMYRQAKEQQQSDPKPDEAEPHEATADKVGEDIASSAEETGHHEAIPDSFLDERPSPKQPKPEEYGNTTNELAEEAKKAIDFQQSLLASRGAAATEDEESLIFTRDMVLYLDIVGAQKPLVLDVVHEIIVGRGDSATDYFPEVDLTPYGAYRLGLSRRHALFRRKQNRLHLTDLGSRNGTGINGVTLSKGEVKELRDGDVVRFGTLKMRVKFKPKA